MDNKEVAKNKAIKKDSPKRKSKLQIAQGQAEAAVKKTNKHIEKLGAHTSQLYDELTTLQTLFEEIRNYPLDKKVEYEKLKAIRLNWKQQAEKIEEDYKYAVAKNVGAGAAGIGTGVAVAALGPSVAMGIATTYGVASTGTAIASLSGAVATKAALAWLGGGALAAGGGGIAAGKVVLAMFGPAGLAIGGVALLGSGLLYLSGAKDKKRLEDIFTLISKRDTKSYDLAVVELNERIARIVDESELLQNSIDKIKSFGLDYGSMTEAQQYELGSYVNLMSSSTQLLVNPIMGLKPKFDKEDLKNFMSQEEEIYIHTERELIVFLTNLLYKIKLDDKDTKILWESLRGNKDFLSSLGVAKKDFKYEIFKAVNNALEYKYTLEAAASK